MANQIAKYKVVCDPPGIQIAGAGAFTKDSSGIFPPGTILNVKPSFEPRACMQPLNDVARKAFEAKRKRIEALWRESLAKGEDPDGRRLEHLDVPLSKEAIEALVKREVQKVGPIKPKATQVNARGRGARLAPGTLLAKPEEPEKPHSDLDDSLADDAPATGRASDSE